MSSAKPLRRRALLGCAAAMVMAPPTAARRAAGFRIVVPAGPAGGWDRTAQALGQALQAAGALGDVSYEYLPGAAGAYGLGQFLKSHPDDAQALLVMGSVMVAGLEVLKSPVRLGQATPIARLTSEYNVFVVPAGSPWHHLGDLLEAFRKAPETVRWGGGSQGSTEHIAAALMAHELGLHPSQLAYLPSHGGGEAALALLSGQVQVSGGSYSEYAELIADGSVRALAVTAPHRLKGLSVPTLREWGLDIEMGGWRGVYAAPGLTVDQRQALVNRVLAAVSTPVWAAALERHRWTASVLTGPAFEEFVERETAAARSLLIRAGLI